MTDLSPALAMHLGRMAVAAESLAPAPRARVEDAIERALHDADEGVCALLDVLLAEALRAVGPGE
ncbi:hypothetical protein [Kitasatospora sp. NPDC127116]|uniref:hypothetical protein n=1 Tax=unclassified Kitasatospora TaxID=2633591 RepID=UPI003644D23D